MLLLLTNASLEHLGQPIAINTDQILSIYRSSGVDESGVVYDITSIFCPPHGVWNVQETPEEIVSLFNGIPLPKKARTRVAKVTKKDES